jgi:hypothetical protein
MKRKQPDPKSEEQLDNEDFVMDERKKLAEYQEELKRLLSERKNAGAADIKKDTDSDSDEAHQDSENDVPDDKEAAQYHLATNAAQKSVASKRSDVDPSNELEGKRKRIRTEAAPAARAANPSEVALEKDRLYKHVCGMRCLLRKYWRKTTQEVALDKKFNRFITAIELMYTYDQRVFAEAERVRRARSKWLSTSEHAYDDDVWVTLRREGSPPEKFLGRIVHESAHGYVVKMPPFGDDNMPLGLRPKIDAACPGKIGPFVSRNEADPIEDCLRILKSDTRWTVDPFDESVEEPAVTEDQCEPESSDEGSQEGSVVSSEREASSSEGSGDENPENSESSSESSDDDEPVVVRLARREDEEEAIRRFRAEYRAAQKRPAEDQLPSGSSKKAK